jgi:phosphate-selective porin OprO/OprP
MFKPAAPGVNTHMHGLLIVLLSILFASAAEAQPETADRQSSDGHPSLTIGNWMRVDFTAAFQGDMRASEAAIRGDEDGGLDIARRRVGVEGRVRRIVAYQIEYELGAREWRDVYVDYRQFTAVQVRAGMFKMPFGLDENTSATSIDFVYRAGISSRLAPGRDRGVSVHGRVLKKIVSYEAGVFANDGDNARPSNSTRVFGARTIAARVLARPFRHSSSLVRDLQIGGAITTGDVPLGFPGVRARTVFGTSFYNSSVWVQGRRQRSGVEARWQLGRASIQSEYIRLTDERRGQSVEDSDLSPLMAHGWYVSGVFRLTPKRYRLGRVEGAARYETLSFGSKNGIGEPSTSVRADAVLGNVDRVTTLGANWHINRWVKVQANFIREDIGRPALGPMPERASFWSRAFRLQLAL